MDTRGKYLNGDIYSLKNVNKIIPRKMELPLFLESSRVETRVNVKRIKFPIYSLFYLQKFKSTRTYLVSNLVYIIT